MNEQQRPELTEQEAQALAWRLHTNLPLGWYVATIDRDPRPGLGRYVELRNDQRPFRVRFFGEEDVVRFYQQHGAQRRRVSDVRKSPRDS